MKRILSFYLRDQHPWKGIVRSRISASVFPFTNPMIDSAQTGALVVAKTEEKGRDSLKHSNRRNKRTAVRRRVTKRGVGPIAALIRNFPMQMPARLWPAAFSRGKNGRNRPLPFSKSMSRFRREGKKREQLKGRHLSNVVWTRSFYFFFGFGFPLI